MASAADRFKREPEGRYQAIHLVTRGCGEGPCVVTVGVCSEELANIYEALDAIAETLEPSLVIWEQMPVGGGRYWLSVEHPDGRVVEHGADIVVGPDGRTLGPWKVINESTVPDPACWPLIPENVGREHRNGAR